MSVHHYRCVALCFVNIRQKGRFCAASLPSGSSMPNEDRSLQTLRIQVERGLPGVFSSYPAVVQTEFDWQQPNSFIQQCNNTNPLLSFSFSLADLPFWTFWDNQEWFLHARCPSCHPTNSVKALRTIQSTDSNCKITNHILSFFDPSTDSYGNRYCTAYARYLTLVPWYQASQFSFIVL